MRTRIDGIVFPLVAALLGLLLASSTASAQTLGSITGEVRDPSGAVMPDASVTVTNTATNASRSTTTNNAGIYVFPDLVPGTYEARVQAAGFEPQVKTNIVLQVQQAARLDFALAVGQATQTIEVSAAAASLTTENATVGTVIENKRIEDLPLNGRNFFQLVALSLFHNHPRGPFFSAESPAGHSIRNGDLLLADLLRASTAAPSYFAPELIEVAPGVEGLFVDGGVSPHNNPALLLLMLATLKGYGFRWPLGADRLMLVSVGTGSTSIKPQAELRRNIHRSFAGREVVDHVPIRRPPCPRARSGALSRLPPRAHQRAVQGGLERKRRH